MSKDLEITHQFRGYHEDGGVCRIEVYRLDGKPPLIVATELLENKNTSVTNMAEFLAAEVMERYLTQDDISTQPPFVWVEMYERDPSGRPTRDTAEDRSIVTFEHYRRERTRRNARAPSWRYVIGAPEWRQLTREEFEQLVAPYRGEGEGVNT